MNKTSRINKIKKVLTRRYGDQKTVVLTDINGKYYIEKDGKKIEVDRNDASYKNKQVIIIKSYGAYEMPTTTNK